MVTNGCQSLKTNIKVVHTHLIYVFIFSHDPPIRARQGTLLMMQRSLNMISKWSTLTLNEYFYISESCLIQLCHLQCFMGLQFFPSSKSFYLIFECFFASKQKLILLWFPSELVMAHNTVTKAFLNPSSETLQRNTSRKRWCWVSGRHKRTRLL